jgi:enamine deaminase RidA (YjgF/YER057c/UK114 family)
MWLHRSVRARADWGEVIRLRLPMRATVQVARLPLDAKVEISAIAVK